MVISGGHKTRPYDFGGLFGIQVRIGLLAWRRLEASPPR